MVPVSPAELVPLPELDEHGRAAFTHRGRVFAVFTHQGEVVVLDGRCPHKGGPLGEGLVRDGAVVCPWHWYRFDLGTGRCVSADEDAVRRYRVVEQDGRRFARIEVTLVRSLAERLRAHARGEDAPADDPRPR